MTEKFNELKLDCPMGFFKENGEISLKNLLKDSVLRILIIIKHTCKDYPEKIKMYLLEYNSYVILKKLPSYFENDEKMVRKSSKLIKIQLPYFTKKKKNTAGNMKMISEIYGKFLNPKEENISEDKTIIFKKEANLEDNNEAKKEIFSNKNAKNLDDNKGILKKEMSIKSSEDMTGESLNSSWFLNSSINQENPKKDMYLLRSLDKYEKNNFKNCPMSKIDNIEILRKIHIDFNNRHYLKPEVELEEEENHDQFNTYNRIYSRLWNEVQIDDNFKENYQDWLEENIWNYYD